MFDLSPVESVYEREMGLAVFYILIRCISGINELSLCFISVYPELLQIITFGELVM